MLRVISPNAQGNTEALQIHYKAVRSISLLWTIWVSEYVNIARAKQSHCVCTPFPVCISHTFARKPVIRIRKIMQKRTTKNWLAKRKHSIKSHRPQHLRQAGRQLIIRQMSRKWWAVDFWPKVKKATEKRWWEEHHFGVQSIPKPHQTPLLLRSRTL